MFEHWRAIACSLWKYEGERERANSYHQWTLKTVWAGTEQHEHQQRGSHHATQTNPFPTARATNRHSYSFVKTGSSSLSANAQPFCNMSISWLAQSQRHIPRGEHTTSGKALSKHRMRWYSLSRQRPRCLFSGQTSCVKMSACLLPSFSLCSVNLAPLITHSFFFFPSPPPIPFYIAQHWPQSFHA